MTKKKKRTKRPKPIPLDKLFAGKKIVVAGEFDGDPNTKEIVSFLRQHGAILDARVSADTDIALLGADSDAVEAEVEELIAAGANIECADDILSLLIFEPERERSIPADWRSFKNLEALPYWLRSTFDFSKADYTGKSIGKLGDDNFRHFEGYHIEGAKFDRAKLKNLWFGEANYRSNSFDGTQFDAVYFSSPFSLTLKNLRARDLSIASGKAVSISGGTINGFRTYNLNRCSFDNLKVKRFECASNHFSFKKCHFQNCSFVDIDVTHSAFLGCTFEQCEFSKGQLRQIKFDKCRFHNVRFRSMAIREIEWRKCDIKDVVFQSADVFDVDFTSSKVAAVKFVRTSKQACIRLAPKQVKASQGVVKSAMIPKIATTKAKRLARAMIDAEHISATFKVKDGSENFKVSLGGHHYHQAFSCSSKSTVESIVLAGYHTTTRELNTLDTLRGLNWLAARLRGKLPLFGTLKIQTAQSPLSRNELNSILTDVITDICGSAPIAADDVVALRKAERRSLKQQREDIVAMMLANDVSGVNEIPAETLKELKKFRNLSIQNKKLANLRLTNIELNGSNFTGCDLRGADFSNSDCQRVNFSNCDLRKAIFKESDLRQVIFNHADLRGVVFARNGLWNSKLMGTDFRGVNLTHCTLDRADMTGAKVAKAKLDGASYDKNTILPADMTQRQKDSMRDGPW